jgi:hypothetical protein
LGCFIFGTNPQRTLLCFCVSLSHKRIIFFFRFLGKKFTIVVAKALIPNKTILPSNNLLTGKELKEQVKILKNYVCLIEVE